MGIFGDNYGLDTTVSLSDEALEYYSTDDGILSQMQAQLEMNGAMSIMQLADKCGISPERTINIIKANSKKFRKVKLG
jgi:hypothetical protein